MSNQQQKDHVLESEHHPMDHYLRDDRLPWIFCGGCGIGSVMNSYVHALDRSGIDPKLASVISGIGCTGRSSGYLNIDGFHTTHGRAIPFASGLKIAKPELNITVFSGDGDLFAIGGNHIIQAARRNMDMTVICVNNSIYGMTGGQVAPTTPVDSWTTTTQYGAFEPPFNLIYLMASAGAVYVARWTALHVRRLTDAIEEALKKEGFCFIEVIAQCPTVYGRRNRYREGINMLKYFEEKAKIKHGIHPKDAPYVIGEEFYIGKFVDIDGQPTYNDMIQKVRDRALKR
ncbi:MAG: thiamine pyrophosphate-dependent enzyme [Candidatus Hodarchaeales archaeon]|jgi:2-oxoglutarate ferredoxin oxidoreductase subunit beta